MYNIFLPQVSSVPTNNKRGVGVPLDLEYPNDVDLLGCSWWYNWTTTEKKDSRFIPMSWGGSSNINIPLDYSGYLLVLNEPESWAQNNHHTPQEGANDILNIANKFTQAKLIIGGTSRWSGTWLYNCAYLLGDYKPAGFHIHYYMELPVNTIQDFKDYVNNCRDRLTGELWLTEFGDENCDGKEIMQAVKELPLDRYAWFATRTDMTWGHWPSNWTKDLSLVDNEGNLTELGKEYIK